MADVTPLVAEGTLIIESYGVGRFRIGGKVYRCPFLTPQSVVEWVPSSPLRVEDFVSIEWGDLELLLIGTGDRTCFLEADLEQYFRRLPLPVETMGTAAACSSYNILAIEGRRVAAALRPLREDRRKNYKCR